MIQELLSGGGLMEAERKISIDGGRVFVDGSSPSPCPSLSPSSISSVTSSPSSSSDSQNLRCPRCDSSNTKFCYYNNYNLTQPRHFCKTCRRYWTKGGALRNIPIGGGCRKTKINAILHVGTGKPATGKAKPMLADLGKSCLGVGLDHELTASPIRWASLQNSHPLSLPRTSHEISNTNNPNSARTKEEGSASISNFGPETTFMKSTLTNARDFGLDPQLQMGLFSRHLVDNNRHDHHQQQQHGILLGEVPSSGILDLYQKLRPPSIDYYTDHSQLVLGNAGYSSTASASTATATSILEPAPIAGMDLGYWNFRLAWSEMPTTNGAVP